MPQMQINRCIEVLWFIIRIILQLETLLSLYDLSKPHRHSSFIFWIFGHSGTITTLKTNTDCSVTTFSSSTQLTFIILLQRCVLDTRSVSLQPCVYDVNLVSSMWTLCLPCVFIATCFSRGAGGVNYMQETVCSCLLITRLVK